MYNITLIAFRVDLTNISTRKEALELRHCILFIAEHTGVQVVLEM